MTNMNKALVLTVGILGSSWVMASSADLNLTSDRVNGGAKVNLGKVAVSGGGMYDKDESTSYLYLGLGVEDSDPNGPLAVGLGTRLYAIDTDREGGKDTTVAAAVGGWYRYTIPQANRLSLYASVYYSPEILSISNADHMYEYEARLEYMTMRNARAYIRYGKMVVVFDNNDRKELNSGLSIGANVDF